MILLRKAQTNNYGFVMAIFHFAILDISALFFHLIILSGELFPACDISVERRDYNIYHPVPTCPEL
jgi:hypothetical protein